MTSAVWNGKLKERRNVLSPTLLPPNRPLSSNRFGLTCKTLQGELFVHLSCQHGIVMLFSVETPSIRTRKSRGEMKSFVVKIVEVAVKESIIYTDATSEKGDRGQWC